VNLGFFGRSGTTLSALLITGMAAAAPISCSAMRRFMVGFDICINVRKNHFFKSDSDKQRG
jgi:hypothetical protein